MRSLGLIVNPVAGMGGKPGLKGTDGEHVLRRAQLLGAVPGAQARALRALERMGGCPSDVRVLAAGGRMGAELAVSQRFPTEVVGNEIGDATSAADTRAAAAACARRGVDLLLFAGGDGTTRDIHDAVGTRVPVVGIPTGVKMQSGVFAATPEAAGELACAYLRRPSPLQDVDVVDVDEEALRRGELATRLYGQLRVPADRGRMIAAKSPSTSADADLDALCRQVARELESDRLYLFGPGTTTQAVLGHLGLQGTLLGIDAVRDGRLVATDLSEQQILQLLDGSAVSLVMGVIGGQGMLFGRGNQPLSAEVLGRVNPRDVIVLASLAKLARLSPARLSVDTGDPVLDRTLCGYTSVRVAPGRSAMMEIATP